MSFTTIKVRVDSANEEHVRVTLFAGNTGQTLANIGQLCLSVGQYQLFGCALAMGAEQMKRHLTVETDEDAFKLWAERKTSRGSGAGCSDEAIDKNAQVFNELK